MSKKFHSLKVNKVRKETSDALTLEFEVPADLKNAYQYKQGQYLTLKFDINGEEVRRAYSMSSSPLETDLAVTIKRVNRGKVSNYIHDNIKAGDAVEVMQPDGRFFTDIDEDAVKTYYLIGAGSGITPLMSILKTVLEGEPKSIVHLLYGNRNEDSIIYKDQLAEMEKRYAGQLTIDHILSQPKREKKSGLMGMFSKGKISWEGKTGRINPTVLEEFLEERPNRNQSAEYFICGPGTLIETTKDFLKSKGIDNKNIHFEAFVNVGEAKSQAVVSDGVSSKMIALLDGKRIEVTVPKGKDMLTALLETGHDAPYSCTAGACATCMAKVTKGKATMDQCFALDDDEIAAGFVLTCQAHPQTEEVEVDFDV